MNFIGLGERYTVDVKQETMVEKLTDDYTSGMYVTSFNALNLITHVKSRRKS